MIPRSEPIKLTETWQNQLKDLITTPKDLIEAANLPDSMLPELEAGHALFPIRTTRSFAQRIQIKPHQTVLNDPILQQILPKIAETQLVSGYSSDPLEEKASNPLPGLIHKYPGRVLFIGATQCAINCRYCFRRHFSYADNAPSKQQWQAIIDYIKHDHSITEFIFSGGDPLVMNDRLLAWFIASLETISHLTTVRVHSRIPIVLPSRITQNLLDIFERSRFHAVWVIHSNHPQEVNDEVARGLAQIRNRGIHLLNQSVLLKDINDCVDTQVNLSRELFQSGVMPYYLHLLDKVSGAAHFNVPERQAKILVEQMRHRLPGYLVPQLVKEVPYAKSKIPV